MDQQRKQLLVFGYGLPVIFSTISTFHYLKHGLSVLIVILMSIATVVLALVLFNQEGLKVVFKYWMKGAHTIGFVLTNLVLSLMYYTVFAPVGIYLRLAKKDFLHRQLDPSASTYWNQREQKAFDKEQCLKQY